MNPTSIRPPIGRERPTTMLDFVDVGAAHGLLPMTLVRLYTQHLHRLQRVLILWVIRDLTEHRRPLHYRSALYSWNAHRARQGLPLFSDDRFWAYLQPALDAGVITATWDVVWAAG